MLAKLKARLGRVETWVWEQLVLGGLVVTAVWAQIAGMPDRVADPRSLRTIGLAVLTGVMVIVGQKVRSTADRQREKNEAAGIENAPLECARAQEFYGVLFQALSLTASIVTAYTPWQYVIVLYVAAYPFWRRFYRARITPLSRHRDFEPLSRRPTIAELEDALRSDEYGFSVDPDGQVRPREKPRA